MKRENFITIHGFNSELHLQQTSQQKILLGKTYRDVPNAIVISNDN
jgi:hypothetical protein